LTFSGTVFWLFAEALFHALQLITGKLDLIMAAVKIEQTDLDNVAAALEALVTTVEGIDTTQLPDADESALNQAVTDVTNAIEAIAAPPASG
jgi:hypothetical protein